MKKLKQFCAAAISLLLLISFAACQANGTSVEIPSAGSSATALSNPSSQPEKSVSTISVNMKICTVDGNTVCGAGLAEPYNEVYTFSCTPEQLSGADSLLPGMIVEAVCDENILESWPAQLSVQSVTVQEQEPDYYALYMQVLEKLFTEDEGLNEPADYFGFDFTELNALRENEKLLLAHEFSAAHSAEPLHGTLHELMDEGYIDEEHLYWEDGVHFTIKEKKIISGKVFYSVKKWRSGLGAIGYDCSAKPDEDGKWVFSEGSGFWIS